MTDAPKNENERIIARIEAVESRLTGESVRVLAYVKNALSPESLAKRCLWDPTHDGKPNVTHLHEVARVHLKPYEKEDQRA